MRSFTLLACLCLTNLLAMGCGAKAPMERLRKADQIEAESKLNLLVSTCAIYDAAHGRLPGDIRSPAGQPLLSWRVAILPFMEEEALYSQFKLNEPWDSPHNRPLVEKMPSLFRDPRFQKAGNKPTVTHFHGIGGTGGILGSSQPPALGQVATANGTSKTILIIETAEAVPWTKPDNLVHDLKQPLPKREGRDGFFLAAFCDGHVQAIDNDIPEAELRSMIQWKQQ